MIKNWHDSHRRNILLLLAKIVAFVISLSYSVLASTIDSVVDLLSQVGEVIQGCANRTVSEFLPVWFGLVRFRTGITRPQS